MGHQVLAVLTNWTDMDIRDASSCHKARYVSSCHLLTEVLLSPLHGHHLS